MIEYDKEGFYWIDRRGNRVEFNPSSDATCVVNVRSNQPVIIDKLYGSMSAMSVRVRLDNKTAEWIVESDSIDEQGEVIWTERARWSCQ